MNAQAINAGHPHELDDPRVLDGVLSRRVLACIIDYLIIGGITVALAFLIGILGILTLGLGWMLFLVWGPIVAIIALAYVWQTLGGPNQATVGMRMMGIKLIRFDGAPIDGMTAVVHSVLFWAGNVVLTPLVLLATLFTDYRRTLHDLLLGTAVIRTNL